MPSDQEPSREDAPYTALPPFRRKRPPLGSRARIWTAVGLVILSLLAVRSCSTGSRPVAPVLFKVPASGPSEIASAPASVPEPPPTDRMQVVPMMMPQASEEPPALKPTPPLAGSRRAVVGHVPVLRLHVRENFHVIENINKRQDAAGWVSVRIDGAELPDFPRKEFHGLSLSIPLPDRPNFRVLVIHRCSDGVFLQADRYEFSGEKVDHWVTISQTKRAERDIWEVSKSIDDPSNRFIERHMTDDPLDAQIRR